MQPKFTMKIGSQSCDFLPSPLDKIEMNMSFSFDWRCRPKSPLLCFCVHRSCAEGDDPDLTRKQ